MKYRVKRHRRSTKAGSIDALIVAAGKLRKVTDEVLRNAANYTETGAGIPKKVMLPALKQARKVQTVAADVNKEYRGEHAVGGTAEYVMKREVPRYVKELAVGLKESKEDDRWGRTYKYWARDLRQKADSIIQSAKRIRNNASDL